MEWKDTIFAVVAAIAPVGISELVQHFFGKESNLSQTIITSIVAFFLLLLIQVILNAHNRLNKYCGQWVEEMTQYEGDDEKERFIGIGLIRHDHMTGEHIFTGKTYSLDGQEKYAWSINYLRADRDDSMQYVCSVQIPSERSIGQITFYNKDECEGVIWCMNGVWYKYNAYRITKKTFSAIDFMAPAEELPRHLCYHGIMLGQNHSPEFVRRYSQKFFPPLLPCQPELISSECARLQGCSSGVLKIFRIFCNRTKGRI